MQSEAIVEEFRKLSTEEKVALLRRLHGELETEAEARPLAEDERRFLEDRLRDIDSDTRPDRDWEDVRADLQAGR